MAPRRVRRAMCKCRRDCINLHTFPAWIPWITPESRPTGPFCESAPYRKFIDNEAADHGKTMSRDEFVQFRRHILLACDISFPQFLPWRYHAMDSTNMQLNSKSGLYWANANHFIRTAADHATNLFADLQTHVKNFEFEVMHIRPLTAFSRNVPELCGKPCNFLFEPWVMVQLTFQPALLHQWAVAALAETLRYCKRLIQIGSRGIAPKFHGVFAKLVEFGKILTVDCNLYLMHFFGVYCERPETRLAQTIGLLEFILAAECTSIFDQIRRESWTSATVASDLEVCTPREIWDPDYHLRMEQLPFNPYNSFYWTGHLERPEVFVCFADEETLTPENGDCKTHTWDPSDKVKVEEVEKVINIILKNGELQGLRRSKFQENMWEIMESSDIEIIFQENSKLFSMKGMISPCAKKYDHSAIIISMLSLQSDLLFEKAYGTVVRQVWLAAKRFDNRVHLKPQDCGLIECSLQHITHELDRTTSSYGQYTTAKILENLEDDIVHYHESFGIPGVDASEEAVARHFEGRIKRLVLNMHYGQYKNLNDAQLNFYPEALIVQYILPCFVTMYLDAAKDPRTRPKQREDCKKFVDELIRSYEDYECVQHLDVDRKKHFYELFTFFGSISRNRSQAVAILQKICKKFKNFTLASEDIEYMNINFKNAPLAQKYMSSPFYPSHSLIQISRLFLRMNACFRKFGWLKREANDETHIAWEILPALVTLKQGATDADKILELRHLNGKDRGFDDRFGICAFQDARVPKSILRDSLRLTTPQILAISIYEAWGGHKFDPILYQGPIFTLDKENDVVSRVVDRDWWNLKRIFAPLTLAPDGRDLSAISMEEAKNNLCCQRLLEALTASRKVQMDQPGQATFFPIKHCRWCGSVDLGELRLCTECKDEPGYPDPNYFCTRRCEKESLDANHTEEHASYVMAKLGI